MNYKVKINLDIFRTYYQKLALMISLEGFKLKSMEATVLCIYSLY